jgi:hypothetical protein
MTRFRTRSTVLLAALLMSACGGGGAANPTTMGSGGPTATSTGSPTAAAAATPGVAAATPTSAATLGGGSGTEADPCALLTKAQAEALAAGPVTVETGALPGPAGQGSFCRYTTATKEELEIRTAVGRGDYDNDRKLGTGNGWHVTDVPGVGDEAWTEKGPFLGSINALAKGQWVRISASLGFGPKPMTAIPELMKTAIQRLP